ncbi:variable large family protein (plasmid) [Borrelia coriaceae]|nr:variable large family protein [Borrelia coriaceae]
MAAIINARKTVVHAAKAVGAVTGADILKAMVKAGGKAITLVNNTAGQASIGDADNAKDVVISGVIALRAVG